MASIDLTYTEGGSSTADCKVSCLTGASQAMQMYCCNFQSQALSSISSLSRFVALFNCPNKQSDSDPIPTWLLKICASVLTPTVYSRFPDGYFPGWFFSRKDVSRKVVSRMVIFPDRTFHGKTIPGWSLSRKDVSRVVVFPD